ncbi:MAG: PQQ-binding-like beta-propeller repeat protein [Verrucomicrobiota bacterium]
MQFSGTGTLATALLLLSFGQSLVTAENWPNWRGPNYNGTSQETGLPETFSKEENVRWKVEMPGEGASTPVIWGDHVFLTSAVGTERSAAMALNRKTGEELWRIEVDGFGLDNRSNYASPSAVTDGNVVIFFFGNGKLIACEFGGKELWRRDIEAEYGEFAFQWTFSSSPVLHQGKVFLQVLQRNEPARGRGKEGAESFLLAFDPASGKELYRHIRPSPAQMESLEAFTTPLPIQIGDREELVIIGGDVITGHDLHTGEEFWRWGTWNPNHEQQWWRIVPSPVYGEGVFLVCAPKKAPVYAVKAGLDGATGSEGLAWKSSPTKEIPVTSDVSTPLYYEGRFYILSSGSRVLNCVDPVTGAVIYSKALSEDREINREKLQASPTAGDGKIYLMNHLGDVFVVKAGDEFELLHHTSMGTTLKNISRSSISISQGNLFIRTDTDLFCIGASS